MTTKTRRRVFLSVLVLALCLPLETLYLQGLTTADTKTAIRQWAVSLDPSSLNAAAGNIQSYPLAYRQAIMGALSPDRRAAVWQAHIRPYIVAHPEFDGGTIALLNTAISAITPDAVSDPTDDTRASIDAIASQIQATLGRDQAQYLLYALGPRDGTFVSAEPVSMKISNYLRNQFTVLAGANDCGCEVSYGCYDYSSYCTNAISCDVTQPWPACGWLWDSPCDGVCVSGM